MHAAALPDVFQPADAPWMAPIDIVRLMESAGPLFVVALWDDAFAGYARAEVRDRAATTLLRPTRVVHVAEMAVVPTHRRRGIGRALLEAIRALARERGATNVSLEVYAFNAEARAFYAREGFRSHRDLLMSSSRFWAQIDGWGAVRRVHPHRAFRAADGLRAVPTRSGPLPRPGTGLQPRVSICPAHRRRARPRHVRAAGDLLRRRKRGPGNPPLLQGGHHAVALAAGIQR